jgi:hypothetical protein
MSDDDEREMDTGAEVFVGGIRRLSRQAARIFRGSS